MTRLRRVFSLAAILPALLWPMPAGGSSDLRFPDGLEREFWNLLVISEIEGGHRKTKGNCGGGNDQIMCSDADALLQQRCPDSGVDSGRGEIKGIHREGCDHRLHKGFALQPSFLGSCSVNPMEQLGDSDDAQPKRFGLAVSNEMAERSVVSFRGDQDTRVEDYAHAPFEGSNG